MTYPSIKQICEMANCNCYTSTGTILYRVAVDMVAATREYRMARTEDYIVDSNGDTMVKNNKENQGIGTDQGTDDEALGPKLKRQDC